MRDSKPDALSALAKRQHVNSSWKEKMMDFHNTRIKPVLAFILENKFSQFFMIVLTVYALFWDDVKLIKLDIKHDAIFDTIVLVAIGLFSAELLLGCFVREDYLWGFFFYLDIIATVSLFFDHTPTNEAFQKLLEGDGGDDSASDNLRAGRAGRVGSRAGRIVRVIRVVRLIRIVKLYKVFIEHQRRHAGDIKQFDSAIEEDNDTLHTESRVGKRLSELTTQRVIILVMAMLIGGGILAFPEATILGQTSQYGIDTFARAYQVSRDMKASGSESNDTTIAFRKAYERALLFYIYYHNPHQPVDMPDSTHTPSTVWLSSLAWLGVQQASNQPSPTDTYIHEIDPSNWGQLFGDSPENKFYMGQLPDEIKNRVSRPFNKSCIIEEVGALGIGIWNSTECPTVDLRQSEMLVLSEQMTPQPIFVAVFDQRGKVKEEAHLNIYQTIFVCIILGGGAMIFSNDANKMVLNPIERMISQVDKIRQNPLYAMKMGDDQYRVHAQISAPGDANKEDEDGVEEVTFSMRCKEWISRTVSRMRKGSPEDPKQKSMETKILENTIIKLGTLLALGFGEAGSEIIGQNMGDDAATVDAMIPGTTVDAIYGFCDIRNFTDTTEVLQGKVLVFVNQVAVIVHGTVDSYFGAPNKNVGDAFLLVWRLSGRADALRRKMADMSVMAFIKVVIQINRSALLAVYREHPALLARLPNYRVRLGFGLHLGWAIEGAIGSEYKIDASYLSPHVNMSSRLEAATKQYGCTILMSEPLVRSCTPLMAKQFRCIDHVALKGVNEPTRIFTVDLHERVLTVDQNPTRKIKNRYKARLLREEQKNLKLEETYSVVKEFTLDEDLRKMRSPFFLSFFQEFEKGYLNYEAGEWDVARLVLEKTKNMVSDCPEDGPSLNLLMFLKEREYDATGWPGYRVLMEK